MINSRAKTVPHYEYKVKSKKNANPLQAGIISFFSSWSESGLAHLASADIPKRYTRYGSLLLLGPTFTHHSLTWRDAYASLTDDAKLQMFACIVRQFPGGAVNRVAMNAPITQTTESALPKDTPEEKQNVMRSPTGLLPLYGDFGPSYLISDDISQSHFTSAELQPSEADFKNAYWTETVQLLDLTQIWAPRWTMFSRGNISEKSRILQDGLNTSMFPGLTEQELGGPPQQADVLDFYVGIGYFAFCYLTRGFRRVWGWDINGWSIEGLRRGCIRNGWGVIVVKVDDTGTIVQPASAAYLIDEIERLKATDRAIRCVAFWGDNKWAGKVMTEISMASRARAENDALSVRHCNLGLLPTSRGSWKDAFALVDTQRGGWLHVHENINVQEIDSKKADFIHHFQNIASKSTGQSWTVACDHVEEVKTYAPGVMHCVYDIKLRPSL